MQQTQAFTIKEGPMAYTWEYTNIRREERGAVEVWFTEGSGPYVQEPDPQSALRILGEDGWELAAVSGDGDAQVFWLKRRSLDLD